MMELGLFSEVNAGTVLSWQKPKTAQFGLLSHARLLANAAKAIVRRRPRCTTRTTGGRFTLALICPHGAGTRSATENTLRAYDF